jgi:hypothetical protein
LHRQTPRVEWLIFPFQPQSYTESMKALFLLPALALSFWMIPASTGAQSQTPPPNEISADLGECSATLTVTSPDGKPVYGAKMQARVQYGVMGVKRLDLEAYTDANGHLKITHLPLTLKKPLYIHVQKADKEQILNFRPESGCEARFNVVLY